MKTGNETVYILLGLISIIGQILIIKKFFVAFQGNELTIGSILSGWMLWTGAGSALLGNFADKLQKPDDTLSIVFLTTSCLILGTLVGIGYIKIFLNIPLAEIVSFTDILKSSVIISPLCILIGFNFTLCSRYASKASCQAIGKVYLYEALGAAIGGILYNFIGIVYLDPFQIALILIITTSSVVLIYLAKATWIKIFSILLCLVSFLILFQIPFNINTFIENLKWKKYNPIYSINTRFSDLIMTKNNNEYTLFSNSSPLFTYPNKQKGENISHIAMLQNKSPKKILIIGGGVSNIGEEILKYPIKKIDFLQIDPAVTKIEKNYIPSTAPLFADTRLKVHHTDGRYFIKNKKKNAYDVVIINLPDPVTIQLNRYYTKEFFSQVNTILTQNGTIMFSAGETANYIPLAEAQFLASIYSTVASVFKKVIVLPLDQNYFIASNSEHFLSSDPRILIERLKKRGIKTKYLREYYIDFNLSFERVNYIKKSITNVLKTNQHINKDLTPISFYFNTILWGSHFGNFLPKFMMNIKDKKFFHLIITITFLSTLLFSAVKIKYISEAFSIIMGVAIMGFSGMLMEIVILTSLQAINGYLYYQIGFALTAFMLGLSAGTLLIEKNRHNKFTLNFFFILIGLLGLYMFLMLIAIIFLMSSQITFFITAFIFSIIMFGGAMLCGMIFKTSTILYSTHKLQIGTYAGWINGADHFGAALGGLSTSIFLIPIYGIIRTIIFSIILLSLIFLLKFTFTNKSS